MIWEGEKDRRARRMMWLSGSVSQSGAHPARVGNSRGEYSYGLRLGENMLTLSRRERVN